MDLNHRPIDFQSIASTAELSGHQTEYFVLRSDTSLPTKHNESEPKVPNTKRRGPRKGIELGGNYVATRSGGETKMKSSNFNDSTLI